MSHQRRTCIAAFAPPLLLLAALLALSIWNWKTMAADTARWTEQLEEVDALAESGDWTAALNRLSESYEDWSGRQLCLHITARHEAVEDAEAMYRRARAFCLTEEITEFRAELADLRDQLQLLAEMETCSPGNIL